MTKLDNNDLFEYSIAATITSALGGFASLLAILYYIGFALVLGTVGMIMLLGGFGIL